MLPSNCKIGHVTKKGTIIELWDFNHRFIDIMISPTPPT